MQKTNTSPNAAVTSFTYSPERGFLTRILTSAPDPNGGQTLTWDAEGRLTQAVVNGTTSTFTYDSSGERLRKVSGSTTSIYPFGDDYEVRNGTVTKYISVEGLGVVAKKVGPTKYWIHTDALGSVQAVTNSSGTVVRSRTFRPYGETLTTTGSHTESRGWIDQRNDSESGLTYLHARYFDPKLGSFLSPGPIGVRGGPNLFAYAFGNPVNLADRFGLMASQCSEEVKWDSSLGTLVVVMTCSPAGGSPPPANPNGTDPRDPKHDAPTEPGDPKDRTPPGRGGAGGGEGGSGNETGTADSAAGAVVAGTIANKPITPTYDLNWSNIKQAALSEAFALALEAYANSAPCGKSKQGALRVAAIGHGVASSEDGRHRCCRWRSGIGARWRDGRTVPRRVGRCCLWAGGRKRRVVRGKCI